MTDVPDREQDDKLDSPDKMATEAAHSANIPFSTPKKVAAARELLRACAVCHTNAGLYPLTHPLITQSTTELNQAVTAIAELGFEEVAINVYKSTLFVENQVFPEESVTYRKLVEELLRRGVSAVTFAGAFEEKDAQALVSMFAEEKVADIEAVQIFLEQAGSTAITVAETSVLEDGEKEAEGREVKARVRETYDSGVSAMQDIETQAKLGKVFEVEPLQRVVNVLLDSLFTDPAAVLGLTAIKGHDDYTLNHSINVCILSLSAGVTLSLDSDSLRSLGLSALLYDLGKVRIPEDILNKQGPLTADEWQIVKSHATEGADLLKRIQLTDQMPMVVAFEHHLRHDMQGYPEAPVEQEQHLFSKIVALCDAYDAMTTRRPFRREIRPDKALAVLMQGRGKAYDPSLTKAFVAMLGIYPMGAIVKLEDDSSAVVFRVNSDDLLHPRVKILADANGRWYDDPEVVDLRLIDPKTGDYANAITECIPAGDAGVDDVWQYL